MTEPNYKSFYDAIIDHLVVIGIYNRSHEHNPKQALRDIITWELDLDNYFDTDEEVNV